MYRILRKGLATPRHRSRQLILPILIYFLQYISFAVSLEDQTHLTSNVSLDKLVPEGTSVTLTCSISGTEAAARGSVLRILRKRNTGGGMDGFEDLANVMSVRVVRVSTDRPDIAATFTVSRTDDGAVFICGDAETLGFRSQNPTTSLTIQVQFDPRSLTLRSKPEGGMREDMTKVITCQTDEGGANPLMNVTWRHLSPLGAPEQLEEAAMVVSHRQRLGSQGGHVTQSNLMVRAHRRFNGHRIECSIEKPGGIALFRQSETLDVIFAPNSVQINPSKTGGISEGEALSLTCVVAVSHPPATVRWFEFPPGTVSPEAGREITDLAQIDMIPGEYGGMVVESAFRVSKTFRSNAATEYRCVVNQAALKNPVIAEYKLQVFYPPAVEVVSLPNDPSESQSVTLSCLAHGGVPNLGFTFSWWHAHHIQLPSSSSSSSSSPAATHDLSPISAKSLIASMNASQVASLVNDQMTQIPDHSERHLILDGIKLDQTGWYGCLVTNAGGTARGLHLLQINFAPKLHHSTKFIQYAQPGLRAEFVLTVDARPSRADFTWFWVGNDDSAQMAKARRQILSQSTSQTSALRAASTNLQRIRRSSMTTPMKAISTSVAPWTNRVKLDFNALTDNSMKFTLAFREVHETDFGMYMCQLSHRAGIREFYFELKPQSKSKGINPDSIRITSEGPRALVEFEPPNSQFYSRIVLRICLFSSTSSSAQTASSPKSGHPSRPSKDLVFLRPVQDARGGPSVGSASADSVASSTPAVDECSDYEVTFVELGFLQVELDRPVADYTFQFLVFRDTQLSQITRQLRLTNETPTLVASTSKMFVQLIIGILIALVVLCIIIFLIYYFCTCSKRRNLKKMVPATSNGLLNGPRTYQTLDSTKPYGSPPSGTGSISADLGLLHPTYARQSLGTGSIHTVAVPTMSVSSMNEESTEHRQTPGSSCQSTKGFYIPPASSTGHMVSSAHPLLENPYQPPPGSDMRGSPSNISHVSALTQRILSEVYLAAAKAASMAVSESIASGSMDAMNQAGGVGYRPSSHYAESVSMTGGSISALDGLSGFHGDSISASMNRFPGGPSNGTSRMRKSSIARVSTPTYQTAPQTPQFLGQHPLRSRLPPGSSTYGWNAPSVLTPQATIRLNEAASALAAAAAAAVLEATGATPDLNCPTGPQHPSRFGGVSGGGSVSGLAGGGGGSSGGNGGRTSGGGQATSSEDGGSISSNSLFPRAKRLVQPEPSVKTQRKKIIPGVRKFSLSNSANESLLPMLNIPPNSTMNYPQMMDPRMGRTPPADIAYLPVIPTDSLWARNFQPIGMPSSVESGHFPELQGSGDPRGRINAVNFAVPSIPTGLPHPPAIKPQPPSSNTSDNGNPNDNTLRASSSASNNDLKPPAAVQSDQPDSPPSISPQ